MLRRGFGRWEARTSSVARLDVGAPEYTVAALPSVSVSKSYHPTNARLRFAAEQGPAWRLTRTGSFRCFDRRFFLSILSRPYPFSEVPLQAFAFTPGLEDQV